MSTHLRYRPVDSGVTADFDAAVDEEHPLPVQNRGDEFDPLAGLLKVEERYQYKHIVAASGSNVIIKASAGFLHALTCNTKGAASAVTTLSDSPVNTLDANQVIAIFDAPNMVAGATAIYDCEFKSGLCIRTITAAGGDYTVSYR